MRRYRNPPNVVVASVTTISLLLAMLAFYPAFLRAEDYQKADRGFKNLSKVPIFNPGMEQSIRALARVSASTSATTTARNH